MQTDYFYARYPLWPLWLPFAGASVDLLHEMRTYSEEDGIFSTTPALLLLFVIAFLHELLRYRMSIPVIEVSDHAVEYGSIFRRVSSRLRIPVGEVAAVEPGGPNQVHLVLDSGRRVAIPLTQVSKAQRLAVRAAIERRLAARGA